MQEVKIADNLLEVPCLRFAAGRVRVHAARRADGGQRPDGPRGPAFPLALLPPVPRLSGPEITPDRENREIVTVGFRSP